MRNGKAGKLGVSTATHHLSPPGGRALGRESRPRNSSERSQNRNLFWELSQTYTPACRWVKFYWPRPSPIASSRKRRTRDAPIVFAEGLDPAHLADLQRRRAQRRAPSQRRASLCGFSDVAWTRKSCGNNTTAKRSALTPGTTAHKYAQGKRSAADESESSPNRGPVGSTVRENSRFRQIETTPAKSCRLPSI